MRKPKSHYHLKDVEAQGYCAKCGTDTGQMLVYKYKGSQTPQFLCLSHYLEQVDIDNKINKKKDKDGEWFSDFMRRFRAT